LRIGGTRVWVAQLDFEVDGDVVDRLQQWLPRPVAPT
jgi:hypothetical protein